MSCTDHIWKLKVAVGWISTLRADDLWGGGGVVGEKNLATCATHDNLRMYVQTIC